MAVHLIAFFSARSIPVSRASSICRYLALEGLIVYFKGDANGIADLVKMISQITVTRPPMYHR